MAFSLIIGSYNIRCINAVFHIFTVIFIGSFHSPNAIFEQLSVIYAIPRYLARSVIFILPYFPTGTMERVDREGQIATAKVCVARISCMH